MNGQELMSPAGGAGNPGGEGRIQVLGAVRWVFRDADWLKSVLIGVVFMLIPVAGPIALAGWLCEIHQRLVRGHPRPMPRLDFADFVHYLSRGVTPFVVQLVVMLPSLLITYGLLAAGGFLVWMDVQGGAGGVGLLIVALVIALFGVVAWAAMAVFVNAAQTRAELTEDLGQSLSFGALMQYSRATWKTVLWKYFLFAFVALGLALCGLVLCYFGMYPAMVILQLAGVSLRFQIYRDHLVRGGAMIAVKQPVALPSETPPPAPAAYPGY